MNSHKDYYVEVLKQEIQILQNRIQQEDCGHLYTTISVLKERVAEIEQELKSESK